MSSADSPVPMGDYFFEGAEKLLELWFQKEGEPEATSLRKIPRDRLNQMLNVAQCHILHHRSNEQMDSYVLSESSMFITDTRLIIKTCGRTQLLTALPIILQLAKEYAGMETVANVYYSRKTFLKPHLQPHPHQRFEHEVEVLQEFFPTGNAYCLGPLNDQWFLFLATAFHEPPLHVDHTLEILMQDCPAEVLKQFSQAEGEDGKTCTRRSGISQLVPFGTKIHEELFDPVGYSMNGLVGNSDHFETNQRKACLFKQTLKVLDCFKPRKFILTLFSNDESCSGRGTQARFWNEQIKGYCRASLQFLRLPNETLVYAQFVRNSAPARIPRVPKRSENDDEEDSNQSDD
ncbi:S-adenosylmethionine decarboxylase proenzyme [Aphelenchoides fujianensis]|nr:S-adenosylmethionine decarboxylase proenzyme [Aphelenchoides fujianensis]